MPLLSYNGVSIRRRNRVAPIMETVCSICIETESSGYMVSLDPCGHYYHITCIMTWFNSQSLRYVNHSCPLCRAEDPTIIVDM